VKCWLTLALSGGVKAPMVATPVDRPLERVVRRPKTAYGNSKSHFSLPATAAFRADRLTTMAITPRAIITQKKKRRYIGTETKGWLALESQRHRE